MRLCIFMACLVWQALFFQVSAQVKPLPNAHAHNDYLHEKPLLDALSYGFTSIEADIHLIDGELYVVHDKPSSLENVPSLTKAYLEPLSKHIAVNKGYVYAGYAPAIYLMIDIKTEAEPTYTLLKKQLAPYAGLLQTKNNPDGRVKVVLSGNRPVKAVQQEKMPLVAIDGRPEDLPMSHAPEFMPVISQNYFKIIKWNGEGTIPEADMLLLKKLAADTHKQGKKLRLWASPEKLNVWKVLLEAGVDFINTDKLQELQNFLTAKP
jgi:glycerophosphoryl diester phosphodiesterase